MRLYDFHFRPNERFLYQYDFGDLWQHGIRVERRLALDETRTYPACIGSQRAVPPEDCGGPWAFMALQDEHAPAYFLDGCADLLDTIRTGDLETPVISWSSWKPCKRGWRWGILTVGG